MCDATDLNVFHPNTAISTANAMLTAVASVPIGMSGENIPKYPPNVVAAVVTDVGNPDEFGRMLTNPEMSIYPNCTKAVVIIVV